MVLQQLLICMTLLKLTWQIDHVLLIWEHKDFKGEEGYVDFLNHNCVPLVPSWKNRISSLNTLQLCYQVFVSDNCKGRSSFFYPMSKNHNDLAAIGFNDVINSFQLCVLDEITFDKNLQPVKREYPFWDFVFDLAYSYQKDFRSRATEQSAISWDFLPTVNKNGSLAEQYQDALDWIIYTLDTHSFRSLSDLTKMRKLAYKVFDQRAITNAARKPKPPLGSEEDAVHFGLETYWKKIVEKIDDEIYRLTYDKKED